MQSSFQTKVNMKPRLKIVSFELLKYMQRGQEFKHPVFSILCILEWWLGKHMIQVMHPHPLQQAGMRVKTHLWS